MGETSYLQRSETAEETVAGYESTHILRKGQVEGVGRKDVGAQKNRSLDSEKELGEIRECLDHALKEARTVKDVAVFGLFHGLLRECSFEVNAFFQNIITSCRILTFSKKVHLSVIYQPVSFVVVGQSYRLKRVINNLVSNGIKALSQKKGSERQLKLAVTFGGTTKEAWLPVCIEVADTGCGMSRKDLEKIYSPGVRLRESKYSGNGSGIGLNACQTLIKENLGGKIEVTSELGKGSRFVVTCALKIVASIDSSLQEKTSTPSRSPSKRNFSTQQLGRKRVLHDLKHPLTIISSAVSLADTRLNVIRKNMMLVDETTQIALEKLSQLYTSILFESDFLQKMIVSDLSGAKCSPIIKKSTPKSPIKWSAMKLSDLPCILVADDNAISRKLIDKQLRRTPLDYTIVADGKDILILVLKDQKKI